MPESPVCPRCGWYVSPFIHAQQCDPKAGAKANALSERIQEALPFVKTTKLGYGHGVLTFEIDKDTNVRFKIRASGRLVQFDDLFCLSDLDPDDVLAMVEALYRIRQQQKERRDAKG